MNDPHFGPSDLGPYPTDDEIAKAVNAKGTRDTYAFGYGWLSVMVDNLANDHVPCVRPRCLTCARLRSALAVVAAIEGKHP